MTTRNGWEEEYECIHCGEIDGGLDHWERCVKHPAHNRIVELQRNLSQLLKEAIKLLKLPHSMCQVSHHSKKDRHELWDECPIDKRVKELLEKYDDLVYKRKKS